MKATIIYKETRDDWCPSFLLTTENQVTSPHEGWVKKKLVRITLTPLPPEETIWRVHVWGADDLGMEFDFLSRAAAQACFDDVIEMQFADIKLLEGMGFKRC